MKLNPEIIYTAHKISDERGYYFWEVRARHGDRIEVAAVCDSKAEAMQTMQAMSEAAEHSANLDRMEVECGWFSASDE